MSDSISNLPPSDSAHSFSDAALAPSSDSRGSSINPDRVTKNSEDAISSNDVTIISKPVGFEDQTETISALEGRRIANFEIKQFLGGGGMGLVFRGFDAILARSVAIKLLPHEGTSPELVQRFQIEARSAAKLDHPNISRVFQVGSDDACDYIIFEYVEGDNLAQLVRRVGPLPLELGLRYTFQLALALQHAYQRGVVHRDVKPANVVVTDGGKLKLIDLGLARSPKSHDSDLSLTASGVTLGTYDYISPEQARDSRMADVRSDLYSLGCTVFFMFTGQPPYPRGTPIEKIIQHSSEKRPNPADYRTDLPAGLNAITNKLLAIDPDDRFQRPAELIAEIQDFASRNNIPLLGYDDNVIVKKIIQKPTWTMQLIPVLIPIALLLSFVLYLDWADKKAILDSQENARNTQRSESTANSQRSPVGQFDPGVLNAAESNRNSNRSGSEPETASNRVDRRTNRSNKKAETSAGGLEKPSSSAGIPGSEPQLAPLDFVAVGNPEVDYPTLPENALIVNNLAEALDRVSKDSRVTEIRIFSATLLVQRTQVIKIKSNLTLSAAPGIDPIIIFRPESEQETTFLKVRGGSLAVRDLHFRIEPGRPAETEFTPTSAEEFDMGKSRFGALFELDSVNSSTFSECSLTYAAAVEGEESDLPKPSIFRVTQTKSNSGDFDMPANGSIAAKPVITIRNSCVRGEAALIDMPTSFPFTLAFSNSLFVSNRTMLEFGPADSQREPSGSEIEIYLSNMTVISRLGTARLDSGVDASFFPVRIDANQSIFNYANTVSLLSHTNMADDFVLEKSLMFKTIDSFFPPNNKLLTIEYRNPDLNTETRDFNDMGDWLNVTGVAGSTAEVTWQNFDGLSIPAHEHTVFDYELSGGFEKNPAIRKKAGIDVLAFSPIPPAIIE